MSTTHAPTSPAAAAAEPPARAWARGLGRRVLPYAPALAATSVVGALCIRAILTSAGHPAAPLDDTFIHLQYARRLAEGGFFSYVAGQGYTTGATSLLWPLVLAPFYAIGFRGLSLLWIAWLFGTAAHAALAVETARLARPLAGRAAALGAGAMCCVFGAFAWFAWSGMETVPLAWILMRTARVAAVRCEPGAAPPGARAVTVGELCALGVAAPLLRPEGVIASVIAAIAIGVRPASPSLRSRLVLAVPLVGPFLIPVCHLALAGHAASATATVKWLVGNPYFEGSALVATVLDNARLLVTNLLNGGDWTAIFLPEGFVAPILLGLVALAASGTLRRLPFHAAFVALVALGTLLPCTYLSFLWNRVRYIWPFAGAWFVLLACLARELGDLARVAARGRHAAFAAATPLIAGCFVGALATKLPWTIRDLAQSARAIDLQQVALGRWAREHLPADARIGVNDTGAIAYLSGRATFDVVGLTTEGEARYWVAGPGARFEHYEKMPKGRLPTHFIVYPQWMACAPVLGATLTEATVIEQSILGGPTMVAYEASWDLLGSGAVPVSAPAGKLLDELDVADIDSEAAHRFEIRGAMDTESVATLAPAPGAEPTAEVRVLADGGRTNRARDRFLLGTQGQAGLLVMRVSAEEPVELVVRAGDRELGTVDVPAGDWVERTVAVPADAPAPELTVSARSALGRFASYHYWLYAADAP